MATDEELATGFPTEMLAGVATHSVARVLSARSEVRATLLAKFSGFAANGAFVSAVQQDGLLELAGNRLRFRLEMHVTGDTLDVPTLQRDGNRNPTRRLTSLKADEANKLT
ncbi:MAG: uncharacterized protein KVP18_002416 [Porospora cf. gigantea A]|uniref:uncharacterized protein n=1 Tax=Porospora cf. gigantea A TaxID=2853593 RepID=UPI00355A6C23|nr:MAG: hypothetical protein KVP18_002416 [Porospora cf. gigantea A]